MKKAIIDHGVDALQCSTMIKFDFLQVLHCKENWANEICNKLEVTATGFLSDRPKFRYFCTILYIK